MDAGAHVAYYCYHLHSYMKLSQAGSDPGKEEGRRGKGSKYISKGTWTEWRAEASALMHVSTEVRASKC